MRDIFVHKPTPKKIITQGSIITNCIADGYSCKVWGLIITPRCDMSHNNKVRTVHYVPVISYDEWFKNDGIKYLYSKQYEKKHSNLMLICKENHLPFIDNITDMKTMSESITDLSIKQKYESAVNAFFEHEALPVEQFVPSKKTERTMIENLVKDSLPAFQLIESWEGKNDFKIVLLRDLKRLKYSTAKSICYGVLESDINHDDNDLAETEDYSLMYEMVATISSPYIEHIMERFSLNFCRVGVEDLDVEQTINILSQSI